MDDFDSARVRDRGRWILIDARFQLLAVGDDLYPGLSPKSHLDPTARHILLPRVREAVTTRLEREAAVLDDGRRWVTRVVPVLGAASGMALAVLAYYGPVDTEVPQPPLVGSWEWHVTPPGPDQEMRTYWSQELFRIYGIDPPQAHIDPETGWRFWEGAQFFDELVADSSRAELRRVLDEFRAATNTDALHVAFYQVRNHQSGELQHMRLAGRTYITSQAGDRWVRGFSHRVDPSRVTEQPSSSRYLIDAAFRLSKEPLMAVETRYEHIYMTSENVLELGIWLPGDRHLPAMCHPEDLSALRALLSQAVKRPDEQIAPATIRFAVVGGGWTALELTGIGVRMSGEEPHHVLCRVARAVNAARG